MYVNCSMLCPKMRLDMNVRPNKKYNNPAERKLLIHFRKQDQIPSVYQKPTLRTFEGSYEGRRSGTKENEGEQMVAKGNKWERRVKTKGDLNSKKRMKTKGKS